MAPLQLSPEEASQIKVKGILRAYQINDDCGVKCAEKIKLNKATTVPGTVSVN